MTYTVKKQGHKSWADLVGKRISFSWSDGWEEYDPDMILHGAWMPDAEEQDDPRYPMYYVTEEGGGGYGIRESAVVEVTVHEDEWPPPFTSDPEAFETVTEGRTRWAGGKPPTDKEREIINNRRRRKREREGRSPSLRGQPRARGGVDDWLDEHPDAVVMGSDGLDEIVTLSLTREEAKALEKNLEGVLAKLRARLTQDDKPATLEE